MELRQIRMGIVGAGTWGETHASIYAEHLFANPVAICDMNRAAGVRADTGRGGTGHGENPDERGGCGACGGRGD